MLVPYSNLALRFANSAILCWFRALILHALSLRFRRKGLIRESLTPSLPEQISQCASPILQFCAGSVLLDPAMCFANSTILCWLGTPRSCNVLCQFCNSVLARYSSILQCASPILQFCAGSVLLDPACASPVLQFCAGCALKTVHRASISRQFCDSLLTFDPTKVSLILQFSVSSARQPSIRSHCSKLQGIQL